MRKKILFIVAALILSTAILAQTRGTKVGYIDMEYILQNVPNYTEAQSQLEQKAQKWKQEIESKKNEITKLKEALKAEKALLTKGLIEERISEIEFLENENLEFQQKRFGPNGDLITQKNALTKPIQDQVFTIAQDIAERKKYDFIFDKSSDMTMLFAAKRFDISDEIVRQLNRAEKKEQLTKKQLKEEEEREAKKEAIADNPNLSERQKAAETKKLARDADIAARLLVQEERKKAAEDKKLQIIADREAKKNGTAPSTAKTDTTLDKETAVATAAQAKQAQADQRAETVRIRQQAVEDKKKAAEERRIQILADREAKKLGTNPAASAVGNEEEKQVTKSTEAATAAEEAKQKQADARAKILEDRKKVAEENKKAQEKQLESDYKEAYFLAQIGDWDQFGTQMEEAQKQFKGTKWNTPYQFLKVKMNAQLGKDSLAIALLNELIAQNKSESIKARAKNIINEINKRKEIIQEKEALSPRSGSGVENDAVQAELARQTYDIGKKMLADSGLPIIAADTMEEAAQKVVAAANGQ